MTPSERLLYTDDLTIGYPIQSAARVVQSALNLEMHSSQLVALIGANGSGKSTLIRTLTGLQSPLSGGVYMDGQNITSLSISQIATLQAIVLTDRVGYANWSVRDLVAMGRYPHTNFMGRLTAEDHRIVAEAMERVGATAYQSRKVVELSDGERQRVMIAKALAQQTPLIILDEPTAHLDLKGRVEIFILLRSLATDLQRAILVSTHEIELALQLSHQVWMLSKEHKAVVGEPQSPGIEQALQALFEDTAISLEQRRITIKHTY